MKHDVDMMKGIILDETTKTALIINVNVPLILTSDVHQLPFIKLPCFKYVL